VKDPLLRINSPAVIALLAIDHSLEGFLNKLAKLYFRGINRFRCTGSSPLLISPSSWRPKDFYHDTNDAY
jgi:hypothetical protein